MYSPKGVGDTVKSSNCDHVWCSEEIGSIWKYLSMSAGHGSCGTAIRDRAARADPRSAVAIDSCLGRQEDGRDAAQGFLPSLPFTKAPAYARERKSGLLLYLDNVTLNRVFFRLAALFIVAIARHDFSSSSLGAYRLASRYAPSEEEEKSWRAMATINNAARRKKTRFNVTLSRYSSKPLLRSRA